MIKKSNKYLLQCLFEKINYHYSGRTCKLETLVSEDSQEIFIYQSPFTNFHSENSVSDCLLFNLLRRQGPPATVTNWFGLDFFHLLFFINWYNGKEMIMFFLIFIRRNDLISIMTGN